MIFVNHASYIDDLDRIAASRPKHRDYLSSLMEQGRVLAAGPYSDDSGTLIIYDVDSREALDELIHDDPFTTDGIFQNCDLRPWKIVFSQSDKLVPSA